MMDLLKPNTWMQNFLRTFFKHLYTSLAWSYDIVAWATSAGQWRTWQKAGVECLHPGRVLEIGFGTGHMLSLLSERNYGVFGLDPSKEMSQIASRRLRKRAFVTRIVRAQAQALPFSNESFHSVLSTFPGEYIFNPFTLNEAWRVLRPGGVLVIIPGVARILGFHRKEKKLLALADEFVSILYRITGEAADLDSKVAQDVMKRLNDSGFSAQIQHIQQTRAIILRIVATKKGTS
jgi:ubiquinone/menaquinone biosynthesis C-methylase UbiE